MRRLFGDTIRIGKRKTAVCSNAGTCLIVRAGQDQRHNNVLTSHLDLNLRSQTILACKQQCSTVTFLDTRQWASKHSKSLAHKDKPLVQNKARKNTPTKGFHDFLSNPNGNCLSLWQKSSSDLLISQPFCLSPHKLHSTFFPSINRSHGYVFFQLGWKFLERWSHSLFSSCCMTCPLANTVNLP